MDERRGGADSTGKRFPRDHKGGKREVIKKKLRADLCKRPLNKPLKHRR